MLEPRITWTGKNSIKFADIQDKQRFIQPIPNPGKSAIYISTQMFKGHYPHPWTGVGGKTLDFGNRSQQPYILVP